MVSCDQVPTGALSVTENRPHITWNKDRKRIADRNSNSRSLHKIFSASANVSKFNPYSGVVICNGQSREHPVANPLPTNYGLRLFLLHKQWM